MNGAYCEEISWLSTNASGFERLVMENRNSGDIDHWERPVHIHNGARA